MGGLLHLTQRGGPFSLYQIHRPRCPPSTASVPITVLLYLYLLLCGFNVPIKGLSDLNFVTRALDVVLNPYLNFACVKLIHFY